MRTELESLRSALSQAVAKLDELETVSGSSRIVVMGPADRPLGPAAPTMTHFVAGGAVVFFLLGLFGHLFVARTDRRLRDETQLGAALGTTVLGAIDVPEEPSAAPEPATVWRRLARLVVDDRPWRVPELPPAADEAGLEIRYRRAVSRLREHLPPGPGRVLAVVARDDAAARRAAARLADFAAETRLTVQVVEVAADRPTVPDDAVPGVLVVVTVGTWTGWQLVELTAACADAGHDVLGLVVTHRTRAVVRETRTEPALAGAT